MIGFIVVLPGRQQKYVDQAIDQRQKHNRSQLNTGALWHDRLTGSLFPASQTDPLQDARHAAL